MSDLKSVDRGDFTLRDRIARVLHARFGPSLGAAEGGWDDEPAATKDMYREDADAVIREVLTPELLADLVDRCRAEGSR